MADPKLLKAASKPRQQAAVALPSFLLQLRAVNFAPDYRLADTKWSKLGSEKLSVMAVTTPTSVLHPYLFRGIYEGVPFSPTVVFETLCAPQLDKY